MIEYCTRCGRLAAGVASIDGRWYCHGPEQPSCFEREMTEESPTSEWLKGLAERFGR